MEFHNTQVSWSRIKLDQLCIQITDGKHGDCQDQPGSGYYFLSCKDIFDGKVNYHGARQITEADFHDTHRRTKFAAEDILVTNSGTIGRMAIAPNNDLTKRTTFQKSVAILKPNKHIITPKFLYYSLRSEVERLIEFAGGTAQKNLLLRDLRSFEIPLPPLPIQRRIADILSAYDDLIENNQRRIAILETMARSLYREWFVHYRYPGHEAVPLVDSPLGPIPQGWEVRKLGEVCTRIDSGGTPKRGVAEYWESGEINWYKTGELWDAFLFESQEKITSRGQKESSAKLFYPGTILMAIYGSPTVGRMGILTEVSTCNQAALGLVANDFFISQIFLYFTLYSLRDFFNQTAQGAAQQNISKEKVASTLAIIPPRNILGPFDQIVSPIFEQLQALQRQTQNLRRTRDLLLPRLLSGQIDVGDVE